MGLLKGHHKNKISSKRVITLGAFILMGIAFLVDLITDFTIKEELFDSMSYIVIGGLGITASEHFAPKES